MSRSVDSAGLKKAENAVVATIRATLRAEAGLVALDCEYGPLAPQNDAFALDLALDDR
jgi:hypothetical protein